MNNKNLFKDFQLQATDNDVLIEFTPDVMAFMEEGNVIPEAVGVGTMYFMPFAFQRFGDSNCFRVISLNDVNLDEIGLNNYRRLTKEEFKDKYKHVDRHPMLDQ
jgi:hypothetical protein